jgi:hypothetical protein
MKNWPEMARKAFEDVNGGLRIDDPQAVILQGFLANRSDIKPLFEKIEVIFGNAIATLEWLDIQGEPREADADIKFRYWVIFLRSFSYAASIHAPAKEMVATKELTKYEKLVKTAIAQAEKLASTLEDIQEGRNGKEFPHHPSDLDPVTWITEALIEEDKVYDNPVYEELTRISAQLQQLQGRYSNDRYWPKTEDVIGNLAGLLTLSLPHLKTRKSATKPKNNRETKTPGLFKTLVDDFGWCMDTNYAWHLPRKFIWELTGSDLDLMIGIAWGKEPSIEAVIKARRDVLMSLYI